jgi:pimeloyl-ACP methyl ester carboxylesterase
MFRSTLASALILLFACSCGLPGGASSPDADAVAWNDHTFTVAPFDDNQGLVMSASSCGRPSSSTLIVALHDLGYDRRLWSATPQGLSLSMMGHLCGLGFTVLAPDLLGAGQSAHPDGDRLTLVAQAVAVQQLLQRWPRRPDRVVLLGQGAGGAVAVLASTGVARTSLVLLAYSIHTYVFPVLPVSFQPILAQGPYVDFRVPTPGADSIRSWLGYYPAGAAPVQAAWDDWTLGQPAARGSWWQMLQLQGGAGVLRPGLVIHPVLEVLGDRDPWFPATQGMQDQVLFPSSPRVRIETMKQTGHVLPMHLSAPATWQLVATWLQES